MITELTLGSATAATLPWAPIGDHGRGEAAPPAVPRGLAVIMGGVGLAPAVHLSNRLRFNASAADAVEVPPEQVDSARQAILSALGDLTEGRVRTAGELQVAVNLLELAPYRDVAAAVEPARVAAEIAEVVGDEQLRAQIQLIQADLLSRQSKAAEAGRLLFATSAWAKNYGIPHVLSRSHYLMSMFYRKVGDLPSALEHALHALESTPLDALPELRAEHQLAVALAFDESGNAEEAAVRYAEVVEVGRRIGHPRLSINALNNMAYVCCEENRPADALPLIAQMTMMAQEYQTPLHSRHHDTAAKVDLMLGAPELALARLQNLIGPAPVDLPVDASSLAQCLLTAAEAQRVMEDLPAAQKTLNRLGVLCDEQQLGALKVQMRLEQAQLYAAGRRYRKAYEEHRAFHAASDQLRSAEREARARILQVTMGAQEARRDSAHFRELSLRDPLTGLRNRRFINDHLADLLERCARLGDVVSVAMFDLDHFKLINDTLSHEVGDTVLVAFSALLTGATVKPAVAARLGGEEFLVILPHTAEAQAGRWTRNTLSTIRTHDWSLIADRLAVTASVGLSTARGTGWSRERLLRVADQNLYAAKHTGRDRFVGPS